MGSSSCGTKSQQLAHAYSSSMPLPNARLVVGVRHQGYHCTGIVLARIRVPNQIDTARGFRCLEAAARRDWGERGNACTGGDINVRACANMWTKRGRVHTRGRFAGRGGPSFHPIFGEMWSAKVNKMSDCATEIPPFPCLLLQFIWRPCHPLQCVYATLDTCFCASITPLQTVVIDVQAFPTFFLSLFFYHSGSQPR